MEKHKVVPFEFENFPVRTIKDNGGDLWFARADVARVLGYSKISHVTEILKNHGLNLTGKPGQIPTTGSRGRPARDVIPEEGFYCLADSPKRRPFRTGCARKFCRPFVRLGKTGKSAWELTLGHFFLDIWVFSAKLNIGNERWLFLHQHYGQRTG
jgi:hypothetical protein